MTFEWAEGFPVNENYFRKEFIESAHLLGFHVVDIPDEIKSIIPILPLDVKRRVLSRIKQKPYDLGLCHNGKYIACELKIVTDGFTFNLNKIEKHQIENLRSASEAGARSYCIVNFRKGLTSDQQIRHNVKSQLLNVTYALSSDFIQACLRKGKYSIPITFLEELTNGKTSVKKLEYSNEIWELNKLLK